MERRHALFQAIAMELCDSGSVTSVAAAAAAAALAKEGFRFRAAVEIGTVFGYVCFGVILG